MSKYHVEFEDELLTQDEILEHYPKLRKFFRRGDLAVLIRLGSLCGVKELKISRCTINNFKKWLRTRNDALRELYVDPDEDFCP